MKYIIILVVAAVLSFGTYFFTHRKPQDLTAILSESSSTETASSTPSTTPALGTVKKSPSGHAGFTYGAAVNAFTNRRIQFDAACTMIPSSISLKNGTNVMFDNRADVGRYFALDGIRSYLAARDFQILTVRSAKLPHTISVDCGSGKNSGQIILN